MVKDIEFLVKMINEELDILRQRFESGKGTHNETTFNEGRDWALKHVLRMIYSLEELEVLSQEWIDENKVARVSDLRKMTMSDVIPVDKLENLIVPKQELPVIPSFYEMFEKGELDEWDKGYLEGLEFAMGSIDKLDDSLLSEVKRITDSYKKGATINE